MIFFRPKRLRDLFVPLVRTPQFFLARTNVEASLQDGLITALLAICIMTISPDVLTCLQK